jgi:transposase InsO family protein
MGRRRQIRYTAEFKAEAVRIVQTTETPLKVVARNLGVTVTTLRDWIHAGRPQPVVLTRHGLTGSMSRRANCYDNAVVESFFSSMKQELGVDRWPSRTAAPTKFLLIS